MQLCIALLKKQHTQEGAAMDLCYLCAFKCCSTCFVSFFFFFGQNSNVRLNIVNENHFFFQFCMQHPKL